MKLLKSAVKEKSKKKRGTALSKLERKLDDRIFPVLRQLAFSRKSSIGEKAAACWLIGKLRNKKSSETLIELFQKERNSEVIWEIAKGLSLIARPSYAPAVIQVLQRSHDPSKREAAAYVLGFLPLKTSREALLKCLTNFNECPSVRGQAAEALGSLRERKAVPLLIKALQDESVEVRFWATFALGQIGDKKALPELMKLVETDTAVLPGWWSIQKEAAEAIKQLRTTA